MATQQRAIKQNPSPKFSAVLVSSNSVPNAAALLCSLSSIRSSEMMTANSLPTVAVSV